MRVFDAAALLGVDAVCGFVGRNQQRSMDQNLLDFEEHFVPLLKAAKSRGLTYRVEQCPMPGWTTGDNWHNNIAYTPGAWIALHRICERHGVGDTFRIHYDPSHAILMGQDTRSIFQFLKDQGYGFLIAGFHVKGQVIDPVGASAWGYGGQTMERGDWVKGAPSERPADQLNAWKKQVVLCEHEQEVAESEHGGHALIDLLQKSMMFLCSRRRPRRRGRRREQIVSAVYDILTFPAGWRLKLR
jgi:hypothetical protein